jgi:hypothetical protein
MRRILVLGVLLALALGATSGCLRRGRVNPDFGASAPDLEIVDLQFAPSPGFAWQGVPYQVDVLVRNNGAVGLWANAAYVATLGAPFDEVRLGGRAYVEGRSIGTIRMYFDVLSSWTRDGRFAAEVFLADPDRRGEGRAARIWRDANMENHLRATAFPVRDLVSRVRATVVRIRPLSAGVAPPRDWNFTFDFAREGADGTRALGSRQDWPGGGALRRLQPGEWVAIGLSHVFDDMVEMDRVALDAHTGEDDGTRFVTWFYSVSLTVPASLWSRPTYRSVWPSTGPVPPSLVPFELELLLEGLP